VGDASQAPMRVLVQPDEIFGSGAHLGKLPLDGIVSPCIQSVRLMASSIVMYVDSGGAACCDSSSRSAMRLSMLRVTAARLLPNSIAEICASRLYSRIEVR
jgi:hypothetical protein